MTDLTKLVKNYKVFIDTSSLMHDGANHIFETELYKVLLKNSKKVIIPIKVIEELKKHQNSTINKTVKKGINGLKIIKKLQDDNLIDIRGEKNDPFADNLFLTIFTKFRTKYNLCLITQDKGLSLDIIGLKNSRSIESRKSILVCEIIIQPTTQLVRFTHRNKRQYSKPPVIKKNIPKKIPQHKFIIARKVINEKSILLPNTGLPTVNDSVICKKAGKLKLIKNIGSGGEGFIYQTNNNRIIKIYKDEKRFENKFRKLSLMLNHPLSIKGVCWPTDMVFNINKEPIGYLMDKAAGHQMQTSLFIKPLLKKYFPKWTKKDTIDLSLTILQNIESLHKSNVIIGDLNPFNIIIKSSKTVFFVDTDSFQIEHYPCPVGTVNFTPPEIQGKDYKSFLRTKKHEYYAVATLVFMILLPGKPPYSQQGGTNPAANIKKMDFSYPLGEKTNKKTPDGTWRFIWSHLPFYLKDKLYDVFKNNKRIEVSHWIDLLTRYKHDLSKGHLTNDLFPSDFKPISQYAKDKFKVKVR